MVHTFQPLLEVDIFAIVIDTETSSKIVADINSTLQSQITKKDLPSLFKDFKLISLCNTIYNIISQLTAKRLKLIISKSISNQQFVFLENTEIKKRCGIGPNRRTTFYQDKKKILLMIIKLDLSKEHDKIRWLFLTLIMIHKGSLYSFRIFQ